LIKPTKNKMVEISIKYNVKPGVRDSTGVERKYLSKWDALETISADNSVIYSGKVLDSREIIDLLEEHVLPLKPNKLELRFWQDNKFTKAYFSVFKRICELEKMLNERELSADDAEPIESELRSLYNNCFNENNQPNRLPSLRELESYMRGYNKIASHLID
jgi:hypothetical protein